jgi:uncharacterized protein (TIGR03790 family)
MLARATILLTAVFLAVNRLWAGGSGLNVIVVENPYSTNSVQLGNDYCERRGVPPQNVLRLTNWTGGSINWSPTDCQNDLVNPLLAMLANRGLAHQAQFVLLSMDIPYRVTDGANENSTTAVLFYGFKTNGAPVEGIASCSLPDDSSNSYAYSEQPFSLDTPNTAPTNSFLAMMLTDTSLAAAQNTLARGVAADSTYPTQTVYLVKTDDWARNVRFVEFDNAVFENRVLGNDALQRINTDSTDFTNLFGLQEGLAQYSLETNTFVPGGLGDTLTSFAGCILDPTSQTTALAYLEAGASGSYGTIVEPCNYTQKFPDPVDFFYQTRGFSLAEAYYQSLLNPFQGLFVGEPLAAPFARPGGAAWADLTNGTVLAGTAVLDPVFTAAANLPLDQVDLFVDGTYFATMTNLPPSAGNVLSVVLNGNTINYTVPAGATLLTVAAGLANAVAGQSNVTQVMAFPAGDRVELQGLDVDLPGTNVTVSATNTVGSAGSLTTFVEAARPECLDTMATGYLVATFYNAPEVGDWLAVTFLKTNGTAVTLAVTNTVAGATIGALAQNLMGLINSTSALQSADGVEVADYFDDDPYGEAAAQFFVYANSAGWPAAQILATWTSSTNLQVTPSDMNPLADNVSDLRPRNHLFVTAGTTNLTVNYPCDTTLLADGYHELAAVAYEGSSVATQTRVTRCVVVQNTALTASLVDSTTDTNVTLAQVLQFTVSANITNLAQVELFGTGGSLGVVTNQNPAVFEVVAADLGLGLHPFYALVTDQAGERYRTQTVWKRIPAPFPLTLTGNSTLSWPTIAGRQYDLQFTTNPAAGFQTLTTITASGTGAQWPINLTNQAGFYRVKLVL